MFKASNLLISIFLMLTIAPAYAAHTLFQYGTINGQAHNSQQLFTIKKLKESGNFGLGTFEHNDGEMIVIDDKVYQINQKGQAHEVSLSAKSPIAVLTRFNAQQQKSVIKNRSYQSLLKQLTLKLKDKKSVYAIQIKGEFKYLTLKSSNKHLTKPFNKNAGEYSHYKLKHISGTLVGFWSPEYLKTLNISGYHFHFISNDKKIGGHVDDLKLQKGIVSIQEIRKINVVL